MTDMDAMFLDLFSDVEEESASGCFMIDSEDKAVWAIEKIKDAEEDAERQIKCCQMIISRAEAKIDFIKGNLSLDTGHLKDLLVEWMDSQKCKETKTQYSLKMPNGTLKKTKPSLVLEHDDNAVLSWLKESGHTDFIKTKESLDWAALKKVVSGDKESGVVVMETGEIVEGITPVEKEGSFSIKFD